MKCFVCDAKINPVPGAGEFKRVKCPQCGDYQISKAALEVLRISPEMNYQVDVSAQHSWLNGKRRAGRGVPTIGSRELRLIRRQSNTAKAV